MAGKWQHGDGEQMAGVEFDGHGGCRYYRFRELSRPGTYRLTEGLMMELHLEGEAEKEVLKVAVSGPALTLQEKDEKPIAWQRVEQFDAAIAHPNGKPNEQQKRWIVGSWLAVSKDDFQQPKRLLFDFGDDGTFLRLEEDRLLGTQVVAGRYEMHPHADNFVRLTHPDTGAAEEVYAEVAQNGIGMLDKESSNQLLLRFQKVKWERPLAGQRSRGAEELRNCMRSAARTRRRLRRSTTNRR